MAQTVSLPGENHGGGAFYRMGCSRATSVSVRMKEGDALKHVVVGKLRWIENGTGNKVGKGEWETEMEKRLQGR